MNYKKVYYERLQEPLPTDWEIHHLDRDRKNNNFINLVALPKAIHRKYHYLLKQLEINYNQLFNFNTFMSKITCLGIPCEVGHQRNFISSLNDDIAKLEEIEAQIMYYVRLRDKKAKVSLSEMFGGIV